jgi:hypothetical protein
MYALMEGGIRVLDTPLFETLAACQTVSAVMQYCMYVAL